jgi:hypothetical protein
VPVGPAVNGNGRHGTSEPPLDDSEAIERIRALDAAAPSGRVSRLEIQKNLSCGGSRAARLAGIARQPAADLARAQVAAR